MPCMCTLRATVAAILTAALLALSAPAQARSILVGDPTGDAAGPRPGLDITSVAFHNGDSAVVVHLSFVRDVRGAVIVALRTRQHRVVAVVVSKHRRTGPDTTFLVGHKASCRDLTSTWDRATATLGLRLPAACVLNGNYGAVKAWALTERLHDGADVDYAPQKPNGNIAYTDWIPRG
ncbi:MAG: hypothetical protein QOD35_1038 [Nocardioidaceae bacterium]|nr:hypothetical protein [Nocardioidaceae bacterium]